MVTHTNRDIAVIGMAARMPEANNPEEFWENLRAGRESIRTFPETRIQELAELLGNRPTGAYVKGGYLDQISQFDPEYFNISAEECRYMDPQHRLLLELVEEALEDAGYSSEKMSGQTVGVFTAAANNVYGSQLDPSSPMVLVNSLTSALAGRVSYTFNFFGPTLTIDTACSSSLVALHYACQSLRNEECICAVTGGVSLNIFPPSLAFAESSPIWSPREQVRAFDKDADGSVGGEGGAVLFLKRLDRAIADGDQIHAIIKGSAVNSDGRRSNGLSAPNQYAQADAIASALENAGVDPTTISYIETHGTGTKLGDPIEVQGIQLAFSRFTDRKQFIPIGSLKTNIGHLNPAAGVASVVKVILALKHHQLPPSLHFTGPNREIDFLNSPTYVNSTLAPWDVQGVRRAGVTSLGLIGTNVHMILEEATAPEGVQQNPTQPCTCAEAKTSNLAEIFTLSAKNPHSLEQMVGDLCRHLKKFPGKCLSDIAYTLNTGRNHFKERIAVMAASHEELIDQLMTAGVEIAKQPARGRQQMLQNLSPTFIYADLEGEGLEFSSLMKMEIFRRNYEACLHEAGMTKVNGTTCHANAASKCEGSELDRKYGVERATSHSHFRVISTERDTWTNIPLQVRYFAYQYAYTQLMFACGLKPKAVLGVGFGKQVADVVKGKITLAEALKTVQAMPVNPQSVEQAKLQGVIDKMLKDGQNVFITIGQTSTFGQMVAEILQSVPALNCTLLPEISALHASLVHFYREGVSIEWDTLYVGQGRKRLSLPTYAFNRRSYLVKPRDLKFAGLHEVAATRESSQTAVVREVGFADILAIFKDAIPDEIRVDSGFEETGGDSLAVMQIAELLKKEYHVSIPLDLFYTVSPVQRLIEEIVGRIQTKVAQMAGQAALSANSEKSAKTGASGTPTAQKDQLVVKSGSVCVNSSTSCHAQSNVQHLAGSASGNLSVSDITIERSDPFAVSTATIDGSNALAVAAERRRIVDSDSRFALPILSVQEPEAFFLTGVTGFLGAHLINDLLRETSSQIYCLVRGNSAAEAEGRCKDRLKFYYGEEVLSQFGKRLHVVPGDINEPQLGMVENTYSDLAHRMDSIIHSAADVRHVGNYAHLEKSNVRGTQNMLDFAFTGRKKVFHHISTLAVAGYNTQQVMTEDRLEIGQEFEANVYAESKFAAEQLIFAAREQGLTASIYRIGNLIGRYTDGVFQQNIETNIFYNLLKGIIILGKVSPFLGKENLELLPIDTCTDAVAKLILSREFQGSTFHLTNPYGLTIFELCELINQLGGNIEVVDDDEFYDQCYQQVQTHGFMQEVSWIFNALKGRNDADYRERVPMKFDHTFSFAVLDKMGFVWPKVEKDFLKKIFDYTAQVGYMSIGK